MEVDKKYRRGEELPEWLSLSLQHPEKGQKGGHLCCLKQGTYDTATEGVVLVSPL